MKTPHPLSRWVAVGVLVAMGLPPLARGRSLAWELPDGACGSQEAMLQAAQTGQAMVQRELARGMPWGDRSLNEYINRLGQNLARSSGSEQNFTFYVVYNPEVNAEAFPGGYVVINSGVIGLAESEGELASVLAHEIAHENSCDWRNTPRKGNLVELIALVPTMVFAGPAGIAIVAGSGWASTLARARFDRSDEQRADRLAVRYLLRAGYDPYAAPRFFQRLQAEQNRGRGQPGGLLATHPRVADRQRNLEAFIPTLPPAECAPHDDTEFLRMRRSVRNYDEIYSAVMGANLSGRDATAPTLSRRPPADGRP